MEYRPKKKLKDRGAMRREKSDLVKPKKLGEIRKRTNKEENKSGKSEGEEELERVAVVRKRACC